MNFISESLKTEIAGEYDIAIIGGGPSGCGCAIAAARAGAKCILIEKFNCLGGMWTSGYVNPLFDSENKSGILSEIIDELKEKNSWGGFWNISFNYEYIKHILDRKLKEAGVKVMLNTSFSKSITENKRVKGVICENLNGRFAILAENVVDCTGDAAVAADAGCPFELGEGGDFTKCQAMTLMFLVGNIPNKYKNGALIRDELQEAYDKAGIKIPFTMPYLIAVPNSKFGVIQFTHMYEFNPLDQDEINNATIEGRRQMIEAYELLTKYNETFKELDLISSAPALGIRESRRIIGEYTLTTEDIINGAEFDDAVADCTFNVDIHTKSNNGQINMPVKPYQVPIRSLIPKGYKGIYVIGKAISGDRNAMASYRVTGNCFQMGENAGKTIADCSAID